MIRQLYDLEDYIFYRSRAMSTPVRRVAETCSRVIGRLADRMDTGRHSRPA